MDEPSNGWTINNSFVIKGNICQTKNSKELDLHEKAFVVCVDGVSKGLFDILPKEKFFKRSTENNVKKTKKVC